MDFIKTNEEIEILRENNLLVSLTLAEIAKHIRPGITTIELDKIAEEFIRDHGAIPAFKGYRGYPATLCTSVNEQVVHGIPSKYELKEGDIISVDCGTFKNGFYGDSAYTFEVGIVDTEVRKLLKITKECLILGAEKAIAGNRVGDIGYVIQEHAERNGFSIVREMVGHGIGRNLHESPEIPNYGKRGTGPKLMNGQVICIEPMINMGKRTIKQKNDGWTLFAADKKPSAHFEYAVAVRAYKADVLTTFEYIEEVLKNKK
jgi:methionyl aminopeptidase